MAEFRRAHMLRWGLGTLLITVAALGIALFRNGPLEAASSMPPDQQAYWNWVVSINQDPEGALDGGIDLLFKHPHLRLIYLRLPDVCREADQVAACREVLDRVPPQDAQHALYRDVARILLFGPDEAGAVRAAWQYVAQARALDPALARLVVDAARADREVEWLPDVEAAWKQRLAQDSSAAGAAFGLGYAANLRSDWAAAEPLLIRVTKEAPNDPEAYRELGRLYYVTGQPAAFEEALEAGIQAAEARHDQEQGLILRGNLGLSLFQQGNLEKAARLFEEALARSRILADAETEGFNLYRLAGVRLKQHRYDEALALLDSAEARYLRHVPRQAPEVLALRGMTLRDMFRFSDAEQVLEQAIEAAREQNNVGVKIQAAVALTQLRYQMGRYADARTVGLAALQDAQVYRQVDSEVAARIALGDVERRLGSFENARLHYEQGLLQAEQAKSRARIMELHNRLGRTALNVGDASGARTHYDALLDYVQQHAEEADVARSYVGLGRVYSQFGNHEQATAYYNEAVKRLWSARDHRLLMNVLMQQIWTFIDRAAFAEAAPYLEEAGRLVEESEDVSAAYRLEVALGNVRLNQGDYRAALNHFGRAAQMEDDLPRPIIQWHLLHATALAHWQLGQVKEAETYFREAISTIEAMRDNLNSRESRAAFVQGKVAAYKNFAAFLEAQGRSAEAFYFIDHARSRSLADLLHTTQRARAFRAEHAQDQVIEAERRRLALAHAMADDALVPAEEEGGRRPMDPVRASYLRREYLRADSVYHVNVSLLPNGRMYTAKPLSPDSARAVLGADEAMIVYNLHVDGSGSLPGAASSAAYVITRDTLYARVLPVEQADLEEAVRFFRNEIGTSDAGAGMRWELTSHRLYEHLIAPVLGGLPATVRHLHIVPEGVLHYLPFAALRDAEGRFLVEHFTLSVVPSASILKICREQNPMLWRSILLVADPDRRLPGSRREAEAIASIPRIRPLKLIGEQATQRHLEEFAEAHDIIHIATHGRFVSRAPWSSYLELHGDVLSVEEIGRLPLDEAYLVTLSACETGLSGGLTSDVPAGDEWIGLNQAFLAAGAPTVVASLWPIDDKVSSKFMAGFYEKLLKARGKSRALAEIQRQFIRQPGTRHPFYWAAFQVFGDPM